MYAIILFSLLVSAVGTKILPILDRVALLLHLAGFVVFVVVIAVSFIECLNLEMYSANLIRSYRHPKALHTMFSTFGTMLVILHRVYRSSWACRVSFSPGSGLMGQSIW